MHDTDSAEHAAHLARRTALAEGVHASHPKPVRHGDNGATLKATTVRAMLAWLGIRPSYSRPRVSDDNPFGEALFRTAKYRPAFPRASPISMPPTNGPRPSCPGTTMSTVIAAFAMSPRQSTMPDKTGRCWLAATCSISRLARNPSRWSRQTRNWTPVAAVTLHTGTPRGFGPASCPGKSLAGCQATDNPPVSMAEG